METVTKREVKEQTMQIQGKINFRPQIVAIDQERYFMMIKQSVTQDIIIMNLYVSQPPLMTSVSE